MSKTVVDPFSHIRTANPGSGTKAKAKATAPAPTGARANPAPASATKPATCCPCHQRKTGRSRPSLKPALQKLWRHRNTKKVRTILVTTFATLGVVLTAHAVLMAVFS